MVIFENLEQLNISEECFNDIVSMVEAMLESLNDQIDKKLKQGEIGLNKALELSDKVKNTMSDEKNRQEEFEKQAKNPKSFENEMRNTQKSKAIGRAQRKGKIK